MAYTDQFTDAGLLDTIGWMALSETKRIAKLAHIFLANEQKISREHRNWDGPNVSNIRPFIKNYYTPPRGKGKATIELVIAEIERQRGIRKERNDPKNQPYVLLSAKHQRRTSGVRDRKNAVAALHYTIWGQDYHGGDRNKQEYRCSNITTIGDTLFLVDCGSSSYYDRAHARIYMRHKPTGEVKVAVLNSALNSYDGIVEALLMLAPEKPMRAMFGGEVMMFKFHEEAFEWRGKLRPWRRISKIYKGKDEAHRTEAKPKKTK